MAEAPGKVLFVNELKRQSLKHKCFALNVTEVSYNVALGSPWAASDRAFTLLVVGALNLGGLL